jgi:hypothetical protein
VLSGGDWKLEIEDWKLKSTPKNEIRISEIGSRKTTSAHEVRSSAFTVD